MSELAPVAARERLLSLDVLRGFALCGVLIGNMVLYSGEWAARGKQPKPDLIEELAGWFLMLFVHSKAQTLLTFLFGFGFAAQLLRAEERGEPVLAMYLRRMAALFVLGWAHVTLLWWGDVTWGYSIAGLGMLLFYRASNRTRVIAGLVLIFVPAVLVRVPEIAIHVNRVFFTPPEYRAAALRMVAALRDSDHTGLWYEHARYALIFSSRLWAWYFLWLLGRFLLGYVAGARRWFEADGANHLVVFRRMARWGGLYALAHAALHILMRFEVIVLPPTTPMALVMVVVEQAALIATALFYTGVIVLLLQRPAWRRVLAIVAPAGRMPLTIYVSQSLVATFLYYGWGLGWSGKVTVTGTIGIALAIFSLQVVLAHLWLRRFRYGPLEWVWRAAVYWKLNP